MPDFARYVGIDYSGAKRPDSRLPGLRVFLAQRDSPAEIVRPEVDSRLNWTRRGVAEWLVARLCENVPTIFGIDHGFSFPLRYFETHGLTVDWTAFLDDFQRHWPTDDADVRVKEVREGRIGAAASRRGDRDCRRLTEVRAGAPKGVFFFQVEGEVATSTHAGLPWLRYIRQRVGDRVHFWPSDGWDVLTGKSAAVEVYPSLWRSLCSRQDLTEHERDAYVVAEWMRQADQAGTLRNFFHPLLDAAERERASIEGWILGVMEGKSPGSRLVDTVAKEDRSANQFPIHPAAVRYIKLGEGGSWEEECRRLGTIRLGFDSAAADRFTLCREKRWEDLRQSFLDKGRDKGTATRFTQETRFFFEDPGSTLWITFMGERLYWGFLTKAPAECHPDAAGVYRLVEGGWRSTDCRGEELTKDRLSGAVTKLAGFRGTSCQVDVADYVVRRINGEKTPEVERALAAVERVKASARELMQLLGPRDFETLVDLVFTTTGWRRLGAVGGTQKTLDLDLELPTTGERAIVQVKSRTTSAEVAEYAARLDEDGPHNRMFFVFHSGDVHSDDERVTLVGPEKLSEMVVDAGLVSWLIHKVS